MTYQQATFVEGLVEEGVSLQNIAESFYRKYGSTNICSGPESYFFSSGKRVYCFSALQGNDIVSEASTILRKKMTI